MLTRCPECRTIFRITEEHLQAADGRVRCGQCSKVFDARVSLLIADTERLEATTSVDAQDHVRASAPASDESATLEMPAVLREDLEAPFRKAPFWGAIAWSLTILVLTCTLVLQYAYYRRDVLAEHASLRPWLVRYCDLAGCSVPLQKDLAQLQVIARVVQVDPDRPDVLLVRATVGNTAPQAQPYPIVQLKLSDLRGNVFAMRRFRPSEYLSIGHDANSSLLPDTRFEVELELQNPRRTVSTFQFDFL